MPTATSTPKVEAVAKSTQRLVSLCRDRCRTGVDWHVHELCDKNVETSLARGSRLPGELMAMSVFDKYSLCSKKAGHLEGLLHMTI